MAMGAITTGGASRAEKEKDNPKYLLEVLHCFEERLLIQERALLHDKVFFERVDDKRQQAVRLTYGITHYRYRSSFNR